MSASPQFRGMVRNGHVELEDSVEIPEGTTVLVTVVEGGVQDYEYMAARDRLLAGMKAGYRMAGPPLSREEIYDRRG